MLRWGALAYALLGAVSYGLALLFHGHDPMERPDALLGLPPREAHVYSAVTGVAFGAAVVLLTRASVSRYRWARSLHAALRPVARSLSTSAILALAALSAFGEELLFRGLLQPSLGLLPQAVLFGLAHQLPGPSRWVWATWAALVGGVLGLLYAATGSLVGPLLAHALVNALNLSYLKAHDPGPRAELGGLLRQP
ncbi:MAG: CPBP family intramembrane metalloprotease [Deltaproteobacteria bacterium]|nr:CPBP family intramembrane metalloprotease [Deltaproteobacteria bacterium]